MSKKKVFALRLDEDVYAAVERWATDEFRSTNGQLEWIINKALKDVRRLVHPQPALAVWISNGSFPSLVSLNSASFGIPCSISPKSLTVLSHFAFGAFGLTTAVGLTVAEAVADVEAVCAFSWVKPNRKTDAINNNFFIRLSEFNLFCKDGQVFRSWIKRNVKQCK